MFSFKPQSKKFKPSWKVKQIVENSKTNPSDFEPKMLWDFRNPPKPIWEGFNIIHREENTDNNGIIMGGDSADFIHGTNENDTIHGQHGSDLIYGGKGDDYLYGDDSAYRRTTGVDTVYGGSGNDVIRAHVGYGEDGNDSLNAPQSGGAHLDGGSGDDKLYGRFDCDTLVGGSGDDHLEGQNESDTMTGGDGADTFIIGHTNELNHAGGIKSDFITDFHDTGDTIQFALVYSGDILFSDLEFSFNANGILIVTHEMDTLAEIQGLNAGVELDEQIEITRNHYIKFIADV